MNMINMNNLLATGIFIGKTDFLKMWIVMIVCSTPKIQFNCLCMYPMFDNVTFANIFTVKNVYQVRHHNENHYIYQIYHYISRHLLSLNQPLALDAGAFMSLCCACMIFIQKWASFQVSIAGKNIKEKLSARRDKSHVLFGGTKILQHTPDKVILGYDIYVFIFMLRCCPCFFCYIINIHVGVRLFR